MIQRSLQKMIGSSTLLPVNEKNKKMKKIVAWLNYIIILVLGVWNTVAIQTWNQMMSSLLGATGDCLPFVATLLPARVRNLARKIDFLLLIQTPLPIVIPLPFKLM